MAIDGTQPYLESRILTVDRSYRVTLPQPLARLPGWITGDHVLSAWLLVGSPEKCRLLSAEEVEEDSDLQSLRAKIAALSESPGLLGFGESSSVALGLRLLPTELRPRKPRSDWRLSLPEPVAVAMEIRPGESKIAALFVGGHIELWTVKELVSALEVPLSEIT